jgi:hypothetical protein
MARDFQNLVDSPGWARLNKVIAEQLEARIKTVMLVPAGDTDMGANPISRILNVEYMKGEYNGLVSAMQLPSTQIDMLNSVLTNEEFDDESGS